MNHKCPICKKKFTAPRDKTAAEVRFLPFCSERCKLIDLGAWLDADYKVTENLPDTEDIPDNLPPDVRPEHPQ